MKYHDVFLKILEPFACFLSQNQECISSVKHFVDLELPSISPFSLVRNRVGPKAGDAQPLEVGIMLEMSVIETEKTKWELTIEFVSKKDGMLRLCVVHGELSTMGVCGSYPIRCVYGWTNLWEDSKVFSSMNANTVCWQINVEEFNRVKTAFALHIRINNPQACGSVSSTPDHFSARHSYYDVLIQITVWAHRPCDIFAYTTSTY